MFYFQVGKQIKSDTTPARPIEATNSHLQSSELLSIEYAFVIHVTRLNNYVSDGRLQPHLEWHRVRLWFNCRTFSN